MKSRRVPVKKGDWNRKNDLEGLVREMNKKSCDMLDLGRGFI